MSYWLKIAICCLIIVAFALLRIFPIAMENPLREILSGVLSLVWIFALLWLIVLLGQVIRRKRDSATRNYPTARFSNMGSISTSLTTKHKEGE